MDQGWINVNCWGNQSCIWMSDVSLNEVHSNIRGWLWSQQTNNQENLVLFPFEAVVLIQLCFWSFRNEMVMNWWSGIWLGLYQCRSECFGRSCLGMCNILPWSWIWFPQGANEDINFNMCTDTKCISSSFKASKREKLKDKKDTFFLIYVMNIFTIEKIWLSYGQAERKMIFCFLMKV